MIENEVALLTKINAPYRRTIDASELVTAILERNVRLAQLGSFFTEISVHDQVRFAEAYGASCNALVSAALAFASYSGQRVPTTYDQ